MMLKIASPLVLLILIATTASAQLVEEYDPPRGRCCLTSSAQNLANQLQDWNELGRYYQDNERLKAAGPVPGRVVFLGDSITDGWKLADSFPGKPYVNRGISGQVTSQMLVRMYPDVIALEPEVVILLAGTNDIAQNNGPQTAEQVQDNIRAITELAHLHGIQVILCSVTPISDYERRPMSPGRPPDQILKMNEWMRTYAGQVGAIYADYFSVLVDENGMLTKGISGDGLHPNAEGYARMAPVAQAAIDEALGR